MEGWRVGKEVESGEGGGRGVGWKRGEVESGKRGGVERGGVERGGVGLATTTCCGRLIALI